MIFIDLSIHFLDTWKRAKQLTVPNLMMQSTGVLTATRERKDEEGTEKLTN